MSDAELERLFAEVRATSDPVARLRLAASLERVGRRDEAVAVLVPGARDSTDVRRALGSFPAWSRPEADAGRTCWVDVLPLVREPRVRWRSNRGGNSAIASALGLVLVGNRVTYVLDPESGTTRFARTFEDRCGLELAGDVLLSEDPPDLEARDVVTGELLWTYRLDRPRVPGTAEWDYSYRWLRAGSRLVIRSESSVGSYAFPDRRRPPAEKATWSVRCPHAPDEPFRVLASEDLVVVWEPAPGGAITRAIDSSGQVRWTRDLHPEVTTLDSAGGASATMDQEDDDFSSLHRFTPSGEELVTDLPIGGSPEVAVLAPDRIVVRARDRSLIVDRATGALVHELPALTTCAAARDVLYGVTSGGAIAATSLRDGKHLWRVDSPLGETPHLVPLHGRLVVSSWAGAFCLDAGG